MNNQMSAMQIDQMNNMGMMGNQYGNMQMQQGYGGFEPMDMGYGNQGQGQHTEYGSSG